MKLLIIFLAGLLANSVAFGQAQVHFNTRVLGAVEAPVWIETSQGRFGPGSWSGPALTAGLYWDNGGSLVPLAPTTTFRTTVGREQYIEPVDITISGLEPSSPATFIFRIWETAAGSFEGSLWRGASIPVTVTTGGGLNPPANLIGLQGLTIAVPEPSSIALGMVGAAALLLRRRNNIRLP